MNLPNQITISRLIIAIAIFVLLSTVKLIPISFSAIMDISLVLFILAAITDFLDGYIARKYDLQTVFGRIADPFADKITISGIFICLIPLSPIVKPWMVVIIVGREFLISGLRGFLESYGASFGSSMPGKLKMTFQCFTVVALLFYLVHLKDINIAYWIVSSMVWMTIAITLLSAYNYMVKAYKILNKENDDNSKIK